jgi:DNA segregation ATPase FtsK/SpoIIIE, S-DNA-T family
MKVERVIVLSWIQDFFQRLRKNEEEEQLDSEELFTSDNELYYTQKKMEPSKEIEARIAYQYPKGQFRFPLIPDEGQTKNKDDKRDRVKRRQMEEMKVDVSDNVTHKKVRSNSKKEPLPKKRMSGPFRPTEIPSPIFGFHRPEVEEKEIVEHELSHFSDQFFIEEQNETEITTESKIETEVSNEQEIPSQDFRDEEVEPAFEDESFTTLKEENTFIDKSPEEIETYSDLETAAAITDEDPIQEDLQSEPPVRSRMPFNVLMLKQDKQKWEQRKQNLVEECSILPFQNAHPILESQIVEEHETLEAEMVLDPQSNPVDKSDSIVEEHYSDNNTSSYVLPDNHLLKPPVSEAMDSEWVMKQEELLNQTLENFNVGASVVNVTQGPSVTRFEVHPEPGVKVNKVTNLTDDIKLSLAARDIRIEAPIPGKHTIGIEVPNLKSRPVFISEIIQSDVFLDASSPLTAVLGLDISGKPIVTDLKKMPHGLIAGATGSGKSVCINSILISLLYKANPEDVKLLLIDPKMVELAPYNHIPHLVSPVITDVKAATAALKWAVDEMERRYQLFAHTGVRDINRFNELAMQHKRYAEKLPFIVIVIDELADLMMMSPADVEEAICRIAQKARACGIHLIIATQRPSVDVITGLIKANVPTRIAFSVSSQVDSRTIIDISGAEKLLGRGDMLFLENGSSKPVRLQGTFVSDEEIDLVVAHIREQREPDYLFEQEELLKKAQVIEEEDELFYEACEFVVDQGGASTSSLQRRFKIGYNRAARLMDLMEQNGYISGANGSKPREVHLTETELEAMQANITN